MGARLAMAWAATWEVEVVAVGGHHALEAGAAFWVAHEVRETFFDDFERDGHAHGSAGGGA